MSAVENASEAFNFTTPGTKRPSSPEGMAVAYGSLLVMAVLPILFGSLRSVTFHNSKLKEDKNEGCDKLTVKDAALFPFLASGVLIAMYAVFKVFSKELINMVITGYFYFLGVLALCHLLSPVINKLIPVSIPKVQYFLKFIEQKTDNQLPLIDYKFTSYDVISFVLCLVFGLWYLIKKHWIANNLFAMAFAVNGVEMLLLNRVYTAFILLCGLFVYDIFWVFYTDVMVTVAKSFEAPIKLVFPQDLLENGISGTNFAMLGLGDIVIPGIFIALLLRFDKSLNRSKNIYFISSFVAYIFGLTLTIFVMHSFKHAQPALLYLVPSCILVPLMLATVKGDLSAMLKYEDYPQSNAEEHAEQSETASNGSTDKDDDRKNAASDSPAKVGRVPGTASPIGEKKKK